MRHIANALLRKSFRPTACDKCQLKFEISAAAKKRVAEQGDDPVYDVRLLRRLIPSRTETLAERYMATQGPAPDTMLYVDMRDGEAAFV